MRAPANADRAGERLLQRIVEQYRADRAKVAAIFDEQLDRSGNALGWLRVLDMELPK